MLDLEGVVAIGEVIGDGPGERSTITSADGTDGAQVLRVAIAEDELNGAGSRSSVGDGYFVTGLERGGNFVDLDSGQGSRDEGSAGEEGLEETHVDGCCGWD